jgi:hypothetical protein
MSDLRAPGEPGGYMLDMDQSCGFDGGDNKSPACGKPATIHLFAGTAEGPGEWAMFACSDHFSPARLLAWDFHEVAAVCGVPGTMWQSKGLQGEGFCYWPEVEAAIHEAASETVTA